MTTLLFGGHESLSNSGCEALLRGITKIVRTSRPQSSFLAPSFDPVADRNRWTTAPSSGVTFVPAYKLPKYVKLWNRVQLKVPAIQRVWIPRPEIPRDLAEASGHMDGCIMTGGDVLSLDYSVASLTRYLGQAQYFISRGKPIYLWAASVGPFFKGSAVEKAVVSVLRRFADISVRESATHEYLSNLGLGNVRHVADPAFALDPEIWPVENIIARSVSDCPEGMVGLNISPLIFKILRAGSLSSAEAMENSILQFMQDLCDKTRLGIVLIPHVDSVDGGPGNSDYLYMRDLLSRMSGRITRISMAPRGLNAAQVKYLIAKCRFFIGARTHATIAAWSTGVPTISLGYSVKARGLNRDIFDHEQLLLDTKKLSPDTLWRAFERLRESEENIKTLLKERMPIIIDRAYQAMPAMNGAGA